MVVIKCILLIYIYVLGDYKQLCEILRLDGAKQKDVVSHKEGATPLMFAAMTGQLDAVKSLHQVNCDLDKQVRSGIFFNNITITATFLLK